MRSNFATTLGAYCLLALAGIISFSLPDTLVDDAAARSISSVQPAAEHQHLSVRPPNADLESPPDKAEMLATPSVAR
jgi:hypothetical protein